MPTNASEYERRGYYVQPGVKATSPSSLFVVVVNVNETPAKKRSSLGVRTWRGCHVVHAFRLGTRWRASQEQSCKSPAELFAWMESRAHKARRNYVVSPDAGEAIALSDWFGEAEASGIRWAPNAAGRARTPGQIPQDDVSRIRRIALRPTCTILDYTRSGVRWCWLSGQQYFPVDEEELHRSVGAQWGDTGTLAEDVGPYRRTPRERARLWMLAFQKLCVWWQHHARAPWGFTAGQLAVGMLRTHVPPRCLCTHTDEDMHRLERDAAFGGRCSTWYFGDVGNTRQYTRRSCPAPPRSSYPGLDGPLYMLDVRSMYPSLLASELFPVRHYSYRLECPPADLLALTHSFGVIAHVTIETDRAEFPTRHKSYVVYPTGRFQTTLTGPELRSLRGCGRVVKVHRHALYDLGRPFQGAALELLRLRQESRTAGDTAWETFAKLVANALGGKLAQRRGTWEERRKKSAAEPWGEWTETAGAAGKPRKFRAIGGLVWEYVRDKVGSGPFTFAFDYLCAYGRLMMRRIRELCPAESIVSQDTDGIWVLEPALKAIEAAGLLGADRPGSLRLSEQMPAARFYGPRHYWLPGEWVLAGFKEHQVRADGRTILAGIKLNPLNWSAAERPTATFRETVERWLEPEQHGQRINARGWGHPVHRS